MYIIVAGCGRVGAQLATLLSIEGHDVVIIDRHPSAFRRLGSAFNGLTLVGNGFDEEVLKKAGIERADAFTAVTDLDNTNIMSAQVAKKIFEVPQVITRMYNPEREPTYLRLGLNVICGTTLVAEEIKNRILKGHFMSRVVFNAGEVEIAEFPAPEKFYGQKVEDLNLPGEFLVSCIRRKERTLIPVEEEVVEEGDIIVACVHGSSLKRIKEEYQF